MICNAPHARFDNPGGVVEGSVEGRARVRAQGSPANFSGAFARDIFRVAQTRALAPFGSRMPLLPHYDNFCIVQSLPASLLSLRRKRERREFTTYMYARMLRLRDRNILKDTAIGIITEGERERERKARCARRAEGTQPAFELETRLEAREGIVRYFHSLNARPERDAAQRCDVTERARRDNEAP